MKTLLIVRYVPLQWNIPTVSLQLPYCIFRRPGQLKSLIGQQREGEGQGVVVGGQCPPPGLAEVEQTGRHQHVRVGGAGQVLLRGLGQIRGGKSGDFEEVCLGISRRYVW